MGFEVSISPKSVDNFVKFSLDLILILTQLTFRLFNRGNNMSLRFFIFAGLILGCSSAYAQKKQLGLNEKQISRAYNNYWSTPVENWSEIIRGQNISSYPITKGDTLSELSSVFFGNETYWTKMWATNPYIKNPHLIYESDLIHFISGSARRNAAPILGYEADPGAKTRKETIAFSVDEESIKLPPSMQFKPLLPRLPGSFPAWIPKAAPKDAGIMAIERDTSMLERARMVYSLESFIGDSNVDLRGVVKGFRNVDANSGSTYNRLYVDSMRDGIEVGQRYRVVERKGVVQTRFGMKYPGVYIYEHQGEVRVRRHIRGKLYEVEVINSDNLIGRGAFLVPGNVPKYDLDFQVENIKDVSATLLRGNQLFGHQLYGLGQVVFLSKGHNNGIEVGDVVRVNEERSTRRETVFSDIDVKNPVGVVKVVSSTPSFATGIVVSLVDFMLPGDTTHK